MRKEKGERRKEKDDKRRNEKGERTKEKDRRKKDFPLE